MHTLLFLLPIISENNDDDDIQKCEKKYLVCSFHMNNSTT